MYQSQNTIGVQAVCSDIMQPIACLTLRISPFFPFPLSNLQCHILLFLVSAPPDSVADFKLGQAVIFRRVFPHPDYPAASCPKQQQTRWPRPGLGNPHISIDGFQHFIPNLSYVYLFSYIYLVYCITMNIISCLQHCSLHIILILCARLCPPCHVLNHSRLILRISSGLVSTVYGTW